MKKSRLGAKITGVIFCVEAIIMFILIVVVYLRTSSVLRKNAINNMQTATTDRTKIIENYMREIEGTLTAYSHANVVHNFLYLV